MSFVLRGTPQGMRRASRRRGRVSRFVVRSFVDWSLARVVVCVLAVAGAGVLLFPMAANWFHDRTHDEALHAYVDYVQAQPRSALQRELTAAQRYNRAQVHGPVGDAYDNAAGSGESKADRIYRSLLDGPQGIMATLQIPRIGVDLAVYHGTAASVLDRGVGHLFGTSLPVGGAGTHSVLAGHSGIPGDTLFSNLHQLQLGDTFTISVLGRVLTYRVDQIRVVLPTQTNDLRAVPGKDLVTLVTCTPIGVNSHRLLVRGVRVPTPPGGAHQAAVGVGATPGQPWWILIAVVIVSLVLLVSTPLADGSSARSARTESHA